MKLHEPGSLKRYDQIKQILREQKAKVQKLQEEKNAGLDEQSISNSGAGLFSLYVQCLSGVSNGVELELSTNNLMHSVRLVKPFGSNMTRGLSSENINKVLSRFDELIHHQL